MPADGSAASPPPVIPARSIEAVIFDTDGVITDTASAHARAWKQVFDPILREWAAHSGEPFRPFDVVDDYLRYVDGRSRFDGVVAFLGSRGVHVPDGDPSDGPDRLTAHGIGNRKDLVFTDHLRRHGVRAYGSTLALVRELRRHGIKTAAVSASRHCRQMLRAAGAEDLFDVVVDGVEAARLGLVGKPDPALFLEAARRLGVQPGHAAVVEDAQAGIEAGRRGRFGLVIGVDRAGRTHELAARGADVVVADLGQVRVVGQVPGPGKPTR